MSGDRSIWLRLFASVIIMTVGCGGQYAMSVALLPIETEFGASRADVSIAYTVNMVFYGLGGLLMGRLFDRYGAMVAILCGALLIGIGFAASGIAPSLEVFWLTYGVLVGVGGAATFAPLMADTALSFQRHRGLAVAICATGNYLAGVLWPPALQSFIDAYGWRPAFLGAGILSVATIVPLSLLLRTRAASTLATQVGPDRRTSRPFGLSPRTAAVVLCIAAAACCVAMAMPQVHLVAYCSQLGYSAKQGAQALSVLFLGGIVSRLASGVIADHIGGIRTLLLGSSLQGVALLLFLTSSDLQALFLFSGFFGLVQGGLVPTYAIIVREHFAAEKAGQFMAMIFMFSLGGMALGGLLAGAIFDYTGSYGTAFLHAAGWNIVNLSAVLFLLYAGKAYLRAAKTAAAG